MPIHGYPGNVITANPVAPTSTVATGVWTTEQQLKAVAAGNWPFTIPTQQISLSARFNSADSAYLSRTPASASNRDTWTLSFWIKRTNLGEQYIFSVADGSASGFEMRFTSGDALRVNDYNPGVTDYIFLITSQLFRDVGAWYHIVLAVDTTQATNTNRVKIYVNGSQVTAFSSTTYPNQNQDTAVNTAKQHRFGAAPSSTPPTTFGNFYLAEVNFIDGQALTPASFGQINAGTGVWEPIAYTGTYGNNGFYLPFNYDQVSFSADFLVVAGGGGGGFGRGGGGGAGGYRTSVGTSGGGGSAESSLSLLTATPYTVTVGAGGAGATGSADGISGSNSVLSTITSTGGGGGGTGFTTDGSAVSGGSGGGGGGGTSAGSGASGTANQGRAGGNAVNQNGAGGGGGASTIGSNGSGASGGSGGDGVASTITGTSVTRGGGGGGGAGAGGGNAAGGAGGGGAGGASIGNGSAGTANTGGGGGGGGDSAPRDGGAGGSGVVIIKIADTRTATFSSGVTSSLSTAVSGFKIYTVTATSTTSETVTFT